MKVFFTQLHSFLSGIFRAFTAACPSHDQCLHSSSPSNTRQPDSSNPAEGNAQPAFTLIELMVALSVFTIVVTMIGAGLFSVIGASARTQNVTEAVNNLNFVLDDMARRMRTGYNFNCGSTTGGNCPGGGSSLHFTASQVGEDNNPDFTYAFNQNAGQITRRQGTGQTLPLTSEELEIENLRFYVVGAEPGISDGEQTRVLVVVSGTAGQGRDAETFSVQTTITQRLLFPPVD